MLSFPSLAPASEPHLYDVVAHGVHLSPTCERGHQMVMELLQRLGLFDGMRTQRNPALALRSSSPSSILFNPTPSPCDPANELLPPHDLDPPAPSSNEADLQRGPHAPSPRDAVTPSSSVTPTPTATVAAEPPNPGKMRLSELADLHLRNMKRGKHGERSATRERRYILDLLRQVVGDKAIHEITVEDAATFADFLAAWPAYRHNNPDFKHMSALNIAAKAKANKVRPIHSATQGKHIKAIKAFFKWCVESGELADCPFRLIQLSRYRDPIPRKKDVFSAQDLEVLFNPDRLQSHVEPHKFWVPLIAFYSGMRVNEICQLYLDDIKSDTVMDQTGAKLTVAYFDVTPFRDGQSVKSVHSTRRVPIHSKLIELGFEAYVADVRKSGAIHLFPGLSWSIDGPGRALTQWFNGPNLRKICGITSHTKSLHCFRHTISTLADRCWVPPSIMRTINGHSDGSDIDKKSYVARGSLLECKNALEKIDFPEISLVAYTPGRFDLFLRQAVASRQHRERLISQGKTAQIRKGRPPKLRYAKPDPEPLATKLTSPDADVLMSLP